MMSYPLSPNLVPGHHTASFTNHHLQVDISGTTPAAGVTRARSASVPINKHRPPVKSPPINVLEVFSNLGRGSGSAPVGGSSPVSDSSGSASIQRFSPPSIGSSLSDSTTASLSGTPPAGNPLLQRNIQRLPHAAAGEEQFPLLPISTHVSTMAGTLLHLNQGEFKLFDSNPRSRTASISSNDSNRNANGAAHKSSSPASAPASPQLLLISMASNEELDKFTLGSVTADSWIKGQMKVARSAHGSPDVRNRPTPAPPQVQQALSAQQVRRAETIEERNTRITAEVFESIKAHKCRKELLYAFLKKLPKVDLHNHMTGSIYSETYLKFAIKKGLYFDPATCLFHAEDIPRRMKAVDLLQAANKEAFLRKFPASYLKEAIRKGEFFDPQTFRFYAEEAPKRIKAQEMQLDQNKGLLNQFSDNYLKFAVTKQWFYDPEKHCFHAEDAPRRIRAQDLELEHNKASLQKFKQALSIQGAGKSASAGHDHFFKAFDTIESLTRFMPLHQQILPVVKHALQQNVKYMELMVELLPGKPIPADYQGLFEQNRFADALALLKSSKWLDDYVLSQSKKLIIASSEVANELHLEVDSITHPDSPIVVTYILEVMRNLPDHLFFAHIAGAMALAQQYPHTVGVNVVGPEDGLFAINHFDIQMKMLNFLHGQFENPNISLHAGEVNLELSAPVDISHHIHDSIAIGKAKRIGHGASLVLEDAFKVLRLMKREKVAVEVCFASNETILNINPESHPMNLYVKAGVPAIACTDDEGITRTSLTEEYVRATNSCNLDYFAIENMVRNGIEHSFQRGQSLYEENAKGYLSYSPPSVHSPLSVSNSAKARLQKKIEAALAEFKATIASEATSTQESTG